MYPSQGPPDQGGDPGLEDRLRGLILSHASANSLPPVANIPPPPGLQPPALNTNSPGQQENVVGGHPQDGLAQPPSGSRKRLNQAQRRQMNSQLSIPVESRPLPGAYAGRGTGNSGQQSHSSWGPPGQHGQFQNTQSHRNQQHQQYSPRLQNPGSVSPYSPRTPFSQHSPQSPMNQYQSGPSPQFQPAHRNQFQQQQQQPGSFARPPAQSRQLYQPGPYHGRGGSYNGQGRRPFNQNGDEIAAQSAHLQSLAQERVPLVGIDSLEHAEKEVFRAVVENICREAIAQHEQQELGNEQFDSTAVQVRCFGSMASGFATRGSDMDLAIISPQSMPAPDSPESPIPRLLERRLLDLGYGARLLTRTRVPIIKLCEKPTAKLLSDLREERAKWENGFTADPEDDEEHEAETPNEHPTALKAKTTGAGDQAGTATGGARTNSKLESSDEKEVTLKQKEHQSLGEYYNTAKRLLRKLGGRDMTSSSPDLSDEECKILNSVSKAFILGLSSEALTASLRNYQSIAPLFDPSLPFVARPLQGICTQVEGERLALAWESRPLTEFDNKLEFDCLDAVEAWRSLQDKEGPFIESQFYSRQLYAAAERLKKISSLQLVFLEQIQYEDPFYYHGRALKIIKDLQTPSTPESGDYITPIVIAHYIAGVNNDDIREALQKSKHGGTTLQQVALHHRALQLAIDYEHALKTSLFDDCDRDIVAQYIDVLRTRDFYSATGASESELQLAAKISSLPDPTPISPNKPRDRYKDHLEFPKTDIGIQCDINFSAQLAIHNTQLLRCYSQSDPRVKAMVLFIKNWAKVRGINTSYRGTLSSYGYVLMVLHYLVNVAQPYVCPNLQTFNSEPSSHWSRAEIDANTLCKGCDVRFWRNEGEIKNLAEKKMLSHNHDSVGALLRGFFEYFAQSGQMSTVNGRGFDWGREVLSLRTLGGLLTKQEKGWVGAKTVVETSTIAAPPTPSAPTTPETSGDLAASLGEYSNEAKPSKLPIKTMEETKEIKHRYLFAIEDPFELEHNVARTVTHNGIVSIRDEFRRAWRIIKGIGKPYESKEGNLLDLHTDTSDSTGGLKELMASIHQRSVPQ